MNNYSSRKLGEGGYGSVTAAMFIDQNSKTKRKAVAKTEIGASNHTKDDKDVFKNEIKTLKDAMKDKN